MSNSDIMKDLLSIYARNTNLKVKKDFLDIKEYVNHALENGLISPKEVSKFIKSRKEGIS
jgi:hypothetical protein